MADDMDVDPPAAGSGKNTKDDGKDKKRFEVKKVLAPSFLIFTLLDLSLVECCSAMGLG